MAAASSGIRLGSGDGAAAADKDAIWIGGSDPWDSLLGGLVESGDGSTLVCSGRTEAGAAVGVVSSVGNDFYSLMA